MFNKPLNQRDKSASHFSTCASYDIHKSSGGGQAQKMWNHM